ncbi:hypothetical protein HDV05_002318 [Chytridiales sp. JEL 0842]|nr:hypothetical protein HDV05_002318 [Chytridiales sp. JEL 0842]
MQVLAAPGPPVKSIAELQAENAAQKAEIEKLQNKNKKLAQALAGFLKLQKEMTATGEKYMKIIKEWDSLSTKAEDAVAGITTTEDSLPALPEKTSQQPAGSLTRQLSAREEVLTIPSGRVSLSSSPSFKRKPMSNDVQALIEQQPPLPQDLFDTLLTFPLFREFPSLVLRRLGMATYEMRRQAGSVLVIEGTEAAELYFLVGGSVTIWSGGKEISGLQAPAFFGELGILFQMNRTATVIAETDCFLVVITKQKLDSTLQMYPDSQEKLAALTKSKSTWWAQQNYVTPASGFTSANSTRPSTPSENQDPIVADQQAPDVKAFGGEFVTELMRRDIRKLPLFSNAPDTFVDRLAMRLQCQSYQPGEWIINFHEPSDGMYFLLSGCVEVVGPTGTVHAEMQSGAFFGEVGILMQVTRTASIRAKKMNNVINAEGDYLEEDQVKLFKLGKGDLDEVVGDFPEVQLKIKETAEKRFELIQMRAKMEAEKPATSPLETAKQAAPTDSFDLEITERSLNQLPLFAGVAPSILAELAAKMPRRDWDKGGMIIECGNDAESMFFLAAGDVDVISEFGEVVDTAAGPTAYFGEVALLEHVPRTASIRCRTACSTYELKKKDFTNMMERNPEFASKIEETSKDRMQKYLMRNVLA